MTRCRQTDALLDATFAGTDLTSAQAEHAAACSRCARALSQAHRFDAELERVGAHLAPEVLPAASDLTDVVEPTRSRGSSTSQRSVFGRVALAAVIVITLLGGGSWFGSAFGGRGQGDGIGAVELDAWLDRAITDVVATTGRGARGADWRPVQVEACGKTAIAFYAERDLDSARVYRWAIGDPMSRIPTLRASGLAGSLFDADVAAIRATLPVCTVLEDPALEGEEAFEALDLAGAHWTSEWQIVDRARAPNPETGELLRSRIVDVSVGGRHEYHVLIQQPDQFGLDRIQLSLGEDRSFTVRSAARDSMAPEPYVVVRDTGSGPGLPVYFAMADDERVQAVELIGPGQALRYTIGSPGFILETDVMEITAYRFLDSDGGVLASGDLHGIGP